MNVIRMLQIGDIHFPETSAIKIADFQDTSFPSNLASIVSPNRLQQSIRHIQKEIELKAQRAVKKTDKLKPFSFRSPIRAEIEVINTLIADMIEPLPGQKRVSGRKITFRTANILEFYRRLRLICNLAANAI